MSYRALVKDMLFCMTTRPPGRGGQDPRVRGFRPRDGAGRARGMPKLNEGVVVAPLNWEGDKAPVVEGRR